MRNLTLASLGLLLAGNAFAQSSVTSTKTGTILPKFLQDVSGSFNTNTESKWVTGDEVKRTYSYHGNALTLSKPINSKLTANLALTYENYDAVGAEDEYELLNPEISVSYSNKFGELYSLSGYINYIPQAVSGNAATEIDVTNKIGKSITTEFAKISPSVALRTNYLYNTLESDPSIMPYYNRLTVGAFVQPKAVKGLGIYVASQMYKSVAGNSENLTGGTPGALTTSLRNVIDFSYSITSSLAVNNTLLQYVDPGNVTDTESIINSTGMTYSF